MNGITFILPFVARFCLAYITETVLLFNGQA